jgi:glycerol-3-phosphate acyltransferase PlsY
MYIGGLGVETAIGMSEVMVAAVSVIVAYLLGSIPSAYVVARVAGRRDIRRTGSGIVGGLNVYRTVGVRAAAVVAVADIGKGALAVGLARWWLELPQVFVLLVGVAAVVGHLWMVFLGFIGGGAIGTTMGVLSTTLPAYGHTVELLVFIAAIVVGLAVTRNVAASVAVALLLLPFILWVGTDSPAMPLFAGGLGLVIAAKRAPVLLREVPEAGGLRSYMFVNSFRRDNRRSGRD